MVQKNTNIIISKNLNFLVKEIKKNYNAKPVNNSPIQCFKENLLRRKRIALTRNRPLLDYNDRIIDGVSIITCTIRQHYIDNVFENYARQTYKNKELIIILNKNDMKIEQWKKKAQMYQNVKLFKLDESISLGTCLNYAIEKAKFDYITKFDDDNYYAPRFIDDLMKVFLTTKADIVGKLSYFVYFEGSKILAIHSPGKENKYVNFLSGSAMIIRKEVFNNIKFPDKNVGEDTEFLLNCVNSGFKLYSSDKFNYVCIRRPSNKDHTWKIKEYTLLKNCKIVARTNDYKRYVTV